MKKVGLRIREGIMEETRDEKNVEKKSYEKPELTRHGKLTDGMSGILVNYGENGAPTPECVY